MKKKKHLTLSDRIKIESALNDNRSIHSIAKELGKADSSIAREIKNNRYFVARPPHKSPVCKLRDSCELMHVCGDKSCFNSCKGCFRVCNDPDQCEYFIPLECDHILSSPFCCNACDEKTFKACRKPHYKYSAQYADKRADEIKRSSREGVSLSPEEMKQIDDLVSPLLLNGQSIAAIFLNHEEEIPCSRRTLYNYVEQNYLTARTIDLPRTVKFKKRYSHNSSSESSRSSTARIINHTYEDFLKFTVENADLKIVELDTVIGSKEQGKVILTMLFRNCSLFIAFLLENKTQQAVFSKIDWLEKTLGTKVFQELFGIILTDRGTEFTNPHAMEHSSVKEDALRTHVFYCDSYCSWQKGSIENAHTLLRRILPKGISFDSLTQEDLTLAVNHINSYPREQLNGQTPYEMSRLLLHNSLHKALGLKKVKPDDVILRPSLLKKEKYHC